MDSFLQGRTHIETISTEGTLPSGEEKAGLGQLNASRKTLNPEQGDAMQNATIETLYEGECLRKIIVHCDCGKELIIDCCYRS